MHGDVEVEVKLSQKYATFFTVIILDNVNVVTTRVKLFVVRDHKHSVWNIFIC
jgi:hypothetical protein